jgi:type I restriction enzyme S subunit
MWKKVSLESISSRIGDGLHGTPKYDDSGEFYFINGNNLVDGKILIKEDTKRISSIEYDKIKKELNEKTVLVAINGTLGNIGLYRDEPVALGKSACYININEKAEKQFIRYVLANKDFQIYARDFATGAIIKNLGLKAVRDYSFNLPPLPAQRKIASILSAYDDLIENNLKRIKLLEEKAFLSYKLIVKSEKLEEVTIEELADVVMGQSPTSDTYTTEQEDNLPFHQGVTNFTNYFVENKTYCKTPIKIAEDGDILFSVRAPVGRINFTNDRICIGRGLCAFRSKKGFQNYFFHQLKEFFFTEDVIGNGAIFNAVTKVELMNVKLKTSNDKVQLEFEKEAQVIYNLILNLTKQNTKLREARDILLPRLMNGEIEV